MTPSDLKAECACRFHHKDFWFSCARVQPPYLCTPAIALRPNPNLRPEGWCEDVLRTHDKLTVKRALPLTTIRFRRHYHQPVHAQHHPRYFVMLLDSGVHIKVSSVHIAGTSLSRSRDHPAPADGPPHFSVVKRALIVVISHLLALPKPHRRSSASTITLDLAKPKSQSTDTNPESTPISVVTCPEHTSVTSEGTESGREGAT